MATEQLAQVVRERNLVLFAGSGFTRDAGLPDWQGFVSSLAARLFELNAVDAALARTASSMSRTDLPAAIQVLLAQAPRPVVSRTIRELLSPTTASEVVNIASRWKPRGLITTNFDRECERVLAGNGYRLSNSEAHLKLVPTAVASQSPFLWKIHGDIDDELDPGDPKVAAGGPFMVLSRADFAALVQGDRGRQLLAGFLAVLQSYSVLFVGYSFSDPDIAGILGWLSANCRFAHPSWFLTLDHEHGPMPGDLQRIAPISDWTQLPAWMDGVASAASKISVRRPDRGRDHLPTQAERETYAAVSLYLSDLESPDVSERVLAAAFFDEITERKQFTSEWLGSRVSDLLGVGPVLGASLAQATVQLLVEYSLVNRQGDIVTVRGETEERMRASAQTSWTRERDDFYESAERRLPAESSGLASSAREAFDSVLLDLCSELGSRMAEWVSRGVGSAVGWPDLGKRLEAHIGDPEELRRADGLLRSMLSEPRDPEVPYLYRLLAATFLANTVRLNPVAAAHLRDSLSQYELYLDANVLLPLVVDEHPNHNETRSVLLESTKAGVRLRVLTPILNEVVSHREVARRDLLSLGGDPSQLSELAAAMGSRTNVFLQGYLRSGGHRGIGSRLSWKDFLGKYTDQSISDSLAADGIAVVQPDDQASSGPMHAEVLNAIRDAWFEKLGRLRDDILNEHEATQFCQIYIVRDQETELANHIWFLSNETVLQTVFKRQPGRWSLPATFPFSAWAAYVDARLPMSAQDPGAVVRAILRGRAEAFELPSPVALVKQRAFGDRVTSRVEDEALSFAMSDHTLMRRVEEAQRAVASRGRDERDTRSLEVASQQAVGEISNELDAQIARLRQELDRAYRKITDLQTSQRSTASRPVRQRNRRKPPRH